jgi:tetratricopeptide (TPR) repeat protein
MIIIKYILNISRFKWIIILMAICFKFGIGECFSQNSKLDSLLELIKTDRSDTNKLIHLNKLSRGYNAIGSYDSAMLFANAALQLGTDIIEKTTNSGIKKTTQKGLATAYNSIGNVYSNQGKYPEALKNYFTCLKIREQSDDKLGQAASYNNIGNVFYYQGNYPEALKNNFASLKIYEAMDQKADIADSYNNIGAIYHSQNNFPEALKNYMASLKIRKIIGDQKGIGDSYNNIGAIYYSTGNFPEALKNYFTSLNIRDSMGNKYGVSSSYNNIGEVYFEQALREKEIAGRENKLEEALKNYKASLKIRESIGDEVGITNSYSNIGAVYTKQKKYNEAEGFYIKAMILSKKIGNKAYLREIYRGLSNLDSTKGDFKGAYENHKLYILYRDSLDNEETRKRTVQSQMTYDFEKREAVANAEHKKELENQAMLSEEKSRKQKVVLFFVLGSLFLVIIFAGFIFRSLKVTRKQKHIIELQKNIVEQQKKEVELQKILVEEHQKEIIDSIIYARRIQQSLLPTEKYIENSLRRLQKK